MKKHLPDILLFVLAIASVAFAGGRVPKLDIFAGPNINIQRTGDVTVTVHAESAANETEMLDVRTGGGAGTSVASIDEDGDINLTGTLAQGGTALTATASEINQVLDGITGNVTAANLDELTDGSSTSLHTHSGGSGSVPSGTIAIWTGTLATIPTGWTLCDENLGTTPLLGEFATSVPDAVTDPGTGGGSDSINLVSANLPSHGHSSGNTSSNGTHTHSGSTDSPSHSHSAPAGNFSNTLWSVTVAGVQEYGTAGSSNTGSDGGHGHTLNAFSSTGIHNHSFTSDTNGSSTAIDNRPAFYQVAFIEKD